MNVPTTTWLPSPRACLLAGLCTLVIAGIIMTPVATNGDDEDRPRYSKQEIRRAIVFYAKRYKLDPAFLRAVIKVESDFRPHAISKKGAVGLMQLTPATADTLRIANIYDPIQNIRGGAKQLRHLLTLYDGNVRLALAAYNAGVRRVTGGKIPRIRETRMYVRNVLRYYDQYRVRTPRGHIAEPPQSPPGKAAASPKKKNGGTGLPTRR